MADGSNLKGIGITLIVLGSLSIALDNVSLAGWYHAGYYFYNAPGNYVGAWAVITGALNLVSSKDGSRCNAITGLVFAILLFFGSAYMTYVEVMRVLAAQILKSTPLMFTHSLTAISGIGLFVSSPLSSIFSYQTTTF